MKLDIKKSIIALSLLAGVSIPAATLLNNNVNNTTNISSVSTQQAGSKAVDTEEYLEIWSPWAKGGVQDFALKEIVSVWNAAVDAKTAPAGAMKVQVTTIVSGYSGITETIQQDIKAGRISDLPDMYINYADSTASLIQLGKTETGESLALDLTKQTATAGVDEMIIPTMAAQNSMIAGGEEGAIYSVPFSTSSQLMGIDAPLLVWMLQQYVMQGGTVTIEGDIMRQVIDAADGYKDGSITTIDAATGDYVSSGDVVYEELGPVGGTEISELPAIESIIINDKDKETIQGVWANNGADISGSSIAITDETFDSGIGMLNLSKEILKVVEATRGELSEQSDQAIYGYDAPANDFYTYAQAETNSLADPNNGIIIKDGDNVIYNILNDGTDAWDAGISIYDYYGEAFSTGAAWTTNNGITYGSDLLKAHQLAFSTGSTAGATYYYDTKDVGMVNPGDVVYTQPPGRLTEGDENNVQIQQGPSFGAVRQFNNDEVKDGDDEVRNEAIALFMDYLVGDTEYEFNTGIQSVYVFPETFDDLKGSVIAADGSTPLTDAVNPVDPADVEVVGGKTHFIAGAGDGTYNTGDPYYDDYEYKFIEDSTGTKIDGYVMADSFYGVELFEWNDATSELGSSVKVTSTSATSIITPSRYMSSESNYIVGTTTVFNDTEYTGQLADPTNQANGTWSGSDFTAGYGATTYFNNAGLIGPSIAYQNIQNSIDGTEGSELSLDPFSITTDAFRTEIKNNVIQQKTDAVNGNEVKSSEDILIQLRNDAIDNGWFVGDKISTWEWWMTLLIIIASLTVIGGIAFLVYWFAFKNKSSNGEL